MQLPAYIRKLLKNVNKKTQEAKTLLKEVTSSSLCWLPGNCSDLRNSPGYKAPNMLNGLFVLKLSLFYRLKERDLKREL